MSHTAPHIPTRGEVIRRIGERLTPLYGAQEARSIALRFVEEVTGLSPTQLLLDSDLPIEIPSFEEQLAELEAGRPVQYVVGKTTFHGREFVVREGVLIPRPETEELVALILREASSPQQILDVGTGSGCIALSLAAELPAAQVFATDILPEALAVAHENCVRLGLSVTLRPADALYNLAECFPEEFDLLVSNPPYVPESDRPSLHTNVREYEPGLALFVPDNDPLCFYRAIAQQAKQMLRPEGRLYFEIYHRYGEQICQLLADEGYEAVTLHKDLFDKPRFVCAQRK